MFLTPSGIVVGADGAGGVSDGTFVVLRKVVICGPRSIATLSGTTAGSTELSGRRVMLDSHKIIAEACKSLQPSQSVRTQTAEIARALTLLLWCLRPKSALTPDRKEFVVVDVSDLSGSCRRRSRAAGLAIHVRPDSGIPVPAP